MKIERQTSFREDIKDNEGNVTGSLRFSALKGDNV
jgi:hypothetical protein